VKSGFEGEFVANDSGMINSYHFNILDELLLYGGFGTAAG
jgi:hypothetical protein